ncbi:MAG TPA: type II toxin-antitoxin system HicB family antitoxin [Candidatus Limnocylindria bacterium]
MVAKRVLISIDERLLERIDEAADRLGMTRSAFLAQSAAREVDGGAGPGADPRVRASLAALDRLLSDARQ